MEKENKKLRDKAKKERNEDVRVSSFHSENYISFARSVLEILENILYFFVILYLVIIAYF